MNAPRSLAPDARARWDELVAELRRRGRWEPVYGGMLEMVCVLYAELHDFRRQIAADGALLRSPRGRLYIHPLCRLELQYTRLFNDCSRDFGLSPIADRRLTRAEEQAAARERRQLRVV